MSCLDSMTSGSLRWLSPPITEMLRPALASKPVLPLQQLQKEEAEAPLCSLTGVVSPPPLPLNQGALPSLALFVFLDSRVWLQFNRRVCLWAGLAVGGTK